MTRFRKWLHSRGIHALCRRRRLPAMREFLPSNNGRLVEITNQLDVGRVVHY